MLNREAANKIPKDSSGCENISQLIQRGVSFWDEKMIKLTEIQSKDFTGDILPQLALFAS